MFFCQPPVIFVTFPENMLILDKPLRISNLQGFVFALPVGNSGENGDNFGFHNSVENPIILIMSTVFFVDGLLEFVTGRQTGPPFLFPGLPKIPAWGRI